KDWFGCEKLGGCWRKSALNARTRLATGPGVETPSGGARIGSSIRAGSGGSAGDASRFRHFFTSSRNGMDRMNATPRFEASRALFLALALAVALPAAPALAQDAARGKVLFSLCAQCHGSDASGNPVTLAPAIAGLPAWFVTGQLKKFRAGGRGTHFDDISGMRMR